MIKKHYWLYVLLLNEDKYYIGITSRREPEDRIQEHFNGFYTAQWVRRFGPKKVLEKLDAGFMTPEEADAKERKLTLEYISKYGYKNVRGGDLNYSVDYRKIGKTLLTEREFTTYISLALMTAGFLAITIMYFLEKY